MNFLEKYIVRKLRFHNKAVEVETRLPCKVSETQLMWLGVFLGLSRVNITGFGMSRVLEIAYNICIYLLILSMIAVVK